MSIYYQLFNFFLFLLSFLKIYSKLLKPEYNNGEIQDPNIDKSYSENNGLNLYYLVNGYDRTMYNIALNPNETLEVTFKIYTDSESLIEALDNGYKLYFGFDLLITNSFNKRYSTDIIICIFDKKDVKCFDYIYDSENNNYIRNDYGIISKNFIFPLGFSNVTLNILNKNVVGYKNYYCIKFNKIFSEPYQNTTLYKWVKYLQDDIIHKVAGFFGIIEEEEDLVVFSKALPIFYNKLLFENGAGLKGNKLNDNMMQFITFIKYALILYFTFAF